MRLRFFYKINQKKEPIPFSNLRKKSKPGSNWREIKNPCCESVSVPCTCEARYFVQLDGSGNPVDGTLIRRKLFPEPAEGIRFMEIRSSKDECCLVTLQFTYGGAVTTEADDVNVTITSVTAPATLASGIITSRINTEVKMELTIVFKTGATGTIATDLEFPPEIAVDSFTWTAGAAGAGTYVVNAHAKSAVNVVYDVTTPVAA